MLSALLVSLLVGTKALPPSPPHVAASIRRFEQNTGQWPDAARFVARTPHGLLVLGTRDARLHLRGADGRPTAIGLTWQTTARAIAGVDRLLGVTNYLTGSDRDRWRTGVAGFRRVRYAEIAPHVDLEFYGATDGFEYDLVVRPGGNPGAIFLHLDGVARARVDDDGSIVLETGAGTFRQRRPIAFQERGGVRTPVDVRYTLRDRRIGFAAARYDRSRPLVIDPAIDFSTYLGGSAVDSVRAVAADASGHIYVAGYTESADFPAAAGVQGALADGIDAFVAKFSPNGQTLVYATYLGGTGTDVAYGLAVTAAGDAYVAGGTEAFDFPVTPGAFQSTNTFIDGFLTRLSADGSALVFSTYLGGTDFDLIESVAVDPSGAAYVTGPTDSADFPLRNAFKTTFGGRSFVSKFTSAGSLVYSTFFGSPSPEGPDIVENRVNLHAVDVDATGAAYVAGDTLGADIDATAGAYRRTPGSADCFVHYDVTIKVRCLDGVVAKLTPAGALAYSTYLRGDNEATTGGHDTISGIAVDREGNATVVGTTESVTFPTTPGAIRQMCPGPKCDGQVFVTRLNPAGSGLVFSALLGGALGGMSGTAGGIRQFMTAGLPARSIAIDALGQTVVAGFTFASDLPAVNAQQPQMANSSLVKLTNGGTVVTPIHILPGFVVLTVAVAGDGTVYVGAMSQGGGDLRYFKSFDGGSTWTPFTAPPVVGGLSVDPNSATTLFTGGARSTDGGVTWTPFGLRVLSPVLARPGSPNVLYARSSDGSTAVLKSTDAGATWFSSSVGIDGFFFPDPNDVNGLVMSPSNPDVMYAWRESTIFVSLNGGASWTPRSFPGLAVSRIAINPSQPSTIYASEVLTGFWKSLDGGATWTTTFSGSGYMIAATSATTLYASTDTAAYRSDDGGDTWTLVQPIWLTNPGVAFSPAAPNTLFGLTPHLLDGFVAALSPSGALVYESYLGGLKSDVPYAVAATRDGGVVVAGFTDSPNFPGVNALQPAHAGSGDAFVTKLRFPQILFSVDTPANLGTAVMPFHLGGWAVDRGAATDDGIDGIHVWAFPASGAPIFVGVGMPTVSRPDIGAWLGPQFANAGFNVTVNGLTPGVYTFAVYPHSSVTNTFASPQLLTVTIAQSGLISIDRPAAGATTYGGDQLGGWAIDRASTTDTGVSTVHVYAYPNPGSGAAPIFLGVADYGVARPDIGAIFGSGFTNAGFNLLLPPLAPGPYLLVAFPFSSVTNAFFTPATVTVTIGPSRPTGSLDAPANGATVTGSFTVGGWAIDQSAPSGTGVDAVHVYASATTGGAPTFLGVATLGVSRPDIGAIFGSPFTPSGYSLNAPALPPGTYDLYAYSRSTVSGSFNFVRVTRVTVQ